MGLYEDLLLLDCRISRDGSLAGAVSQSFSTRLTVDQRPSDYFYLIDLCNPAQAYWTRKRRDVPRSREIANKLALGNRLQRIAYAWMRKIPGYVSEETTLDGTYIGVNGVVGKYDMRLESSFVELKTKPEDVQDVSTIFQRYPQDLEQLCFYAAMDLEGLTTHYLIFEVDSPPFDFTVFRINVEDMGAIRNLLRQRANALRTALNQENPSNLGRCRYHEVGCDFKSSEACSCQSLESLPVDQLSNAISVTRDADKEEELSALREELAIWMTDLFRPWSLLKPRPWYLANIHGIREDYEPDPMDYAYRDALQKAFSRSAFLRISRRELQTVQDNTLNLPIQRTWRWGAILDSRSGSRIRNIIPMLLKVSRRRSSIPPDIPQAYEAELKIAMIMAKSRIGAVVTVYPHVNDSLVANIATMNTSTLSEGEGLLQEGTMALTTAVENQDITGLGICPQWASPDYCSSCPESCVTLAAENPAIEL